MTGRWPRCWRPWKRLTACVSATTPRPLAGCTVTLNLREASLYAKLDVLCKTLGARYEETDDRILFHGPGCAAR